MRQVVSYFSFQGNINSEGGQRGVYGALWFMQAYCGTCLREVRYRNLLFLRPVGDLLLETLLVSPFHVNHPSGYSWDLTFLFIEHSRNSLNIHQDAPRVGETLNGLFPVKHRTFSFWEQTRKAKDLSFLVKAVFPLRNLSWEILSTLYQELWVRSHSTGTAGWGALRQWSRPWTADSGSFFPSPHLLPAFVTFAPQHW